MNARLAIVASLLTLSATSLFAQDYRPQSFSTPDAPRVNVMHHRSTEFGDGVDALSNLVDAQGRFEKNRSEAYLNLIMAERLRLQNLVERERAKAEYQKYRNELLMLKQQRQEIVREQSIARQMNYQPPAVVSARGEILWIGPLKLDEFAAERADLEAAVRGLRMVTSLADREAALDRVNEACQNMIVALDDMKSHLAPNAYDSSCRFVNRLYDDLQAPEAFMVSKR